MWRYQLLEMGVWADRELQQNASVKTRLDEPEARLIPSVVE